MTNSTAGNRAMAAKRKPLSEETKRKISDANKGRKLSEEHKAALRKGHTKMSEESRLRMSRGKGEINHHWTGGNSRYWKRQALTRDDYTCQICGFREVEIMEVDHIKQKSKFPELTLVLDNLLTLCPNCHRRKTIRELKSQVPWNKKK